MPALRQCCGTTRHEPHRAKCVGWAPWAPCSRCRIETVCAQMLGPSSPKCVHELEDDTTKRINQVVGIARGPLRAGDPVTRDGEGNFRPMRSDHFPDDDPMLPSGDGYAPLQGAGPQQATGWQKAAFWFVLGTLNTLAWFVVFSG